MKKSWYQLLDFIDLLLAEPSARDNLLKPHFQSIKVDSNAVSISSDGDGKKSKPEITSKESIVTTQ
jgi:hypothetical protein